MKRLRKAVLVGVALLCAVAVTACDLGRRHGGRPAPPRGRRPAGQRQQPRAGALRQRQVHSLGLIAYGEGSTAASYVVKVQTNTAAPTAPSITSFTVPAEVACTSGQTEVPATWTTTNADGVEFAVDGQPLPAAAGFPASGTGNVPVPCNNKRTRSRSAPRAAAPPSPAR